MQSFYISKLTQFMMDLLECMYSMWLLPECGYCPAFHFDSTHIVEQSGGEKSLGHELFEPKKAMHIWKVHYLALIIWGGVYPDAWANVHNLTYSLSPTTKGKTSMLSFSGPLHFHCTVVTPLIMHFFETDHSTNSSSS